MWKDPLSLAITCEKLETIQNMRTYRMALETIKFVFYIPIWDAAK